MFNLPVRFVDGLVNFVARLGTSRDKASHASYTFSPLDPTQLEAAYRSSAMARRIVDKPAEDCARRWREWNGNKDQITLIEAEEKRLQLPQKVIAAKKMERLHGGSAIYIGVGDGDPFLPLNTREVKKGSIKYLTVLSKYDLHAGDIQEDPREDGFGKPKFYRLARGQAQEVRIHPSRLVLLHGEETPHGVFTNTGDSWGDSVLQTCLDDVKNLDSTKGNIASLVYESKVDVIKVPDLLQNLSMQGTNYENLMLQRMSLGATAKGNNGVLLLDSTEEYEQKSATFSNLPEILDRFMQAVSAAAEIPMTILFGMSPAGLNATGDADIRNYYDRISTIQNFELAPAMTMLDECLILSAIGSRPPELHYNWRALWEMSEKERAEVAKLLNESLTSLQTMNVLSGEALAKTAVNAMTETGAFPGIEEAANEFPVENPGEIETGEPVEEPPDA